MKPQAIVSACLFPGPGRQDEWLKAQMAILPPFSNYYYYYFEKFGRGTPYRNALNKYKIQCLIWWTEIEKMNTMSYMMNRNRENEKKERRNYLSQFTGSGKHRVTSFIQGQWEHVAWDHNFQGRQPNLDRQVIAHY
jgi:hypothetical protein